MDRIKIGIVGRGNLGRAVIGHIENRPEQFELIAVFEKVATEGTEPTENLPNYIGKIDVMLVCVGSSHDAPTVIPMVAKDFNTVDSFDTHSKISELIANIQTAHGKNKRVAVTATGWDPGVMSLMRVLFSSFCPHQKIQSFWGTGVSMGHTNALKNIAGVSDAIQFTVPKLNALERASRGEWVEGNERHKRIVHAVADKSEHSRIEREIREMPNYFAGQEVEVNFISTDKFNAEFKGRNEHGGQVFCGDGSSNLYFKLLLDNNAHFTAQVMLSYAVANYNLQKAGLSGVYTVADIAPKFLLPNNIDLI
jgi:diaminopimelate dehydrogenase